MSSLIYAKSFGLGATAGLRTFAPAVALRRKLNAATILLGITAIGELVGDKLPSTPSRILPAPLLARMASGATAGASLAHRNAASRVIGGVLGGVGAIAGSYGGYQLRKTLVESSKLPDALIAVLEDAIAFGAAFSLTKDT